MRLTRRTLSLFVLLTLSLGLVWACGFDGTLREYLHANFWLPLAKRASHFQQKGVRRISAPYAGMQRDNALTPLAKLRTIYQNNSIDGVLPLPDKTMAEFRDALSAARADKSLAPRDREEVDLIDAKMDMRSGSVESREPLQRATNKLRDFLRRARTQAFLSEARGWLAHIHYQLGEQSAAGKIYLDELNRPNSNLSDKTLLDSLKMTYGYDGGPKLLQQLDDYFDTPEHAAFAIQLATNPHWPGYELWLFGQRNEEPPPSDPIPYERITALFQKHADLFRTEKGANTLALIGMRTALRAGDPPAALGIAAELPVIAAIRSDPDFLWMLASAHFVSHDFASAEAPLLALFASPRALRTQKAAASYGLCGVYQKTRNQVEQLRFALWLRKNNQRDVDPSRETGMDDLSIYWASSGWDFGLLVDAESPIEVLRQFLEKYPKLENLGDVRYALAVRLARDRQYDESARLYMQINAPQRAARMQQLAKLFRETQRDGANPQQILQAKFKLAEYIAANQERLFFNDNLWAGLQRYALKASDDGRFTAEEREKAIQDERDLKDAQEEQWQAYLILRDVVKEAGESPLGRRAANLAITCLLRINGERFGREEELLDNRRELANWLRGVAPKAKAR